MSKTLTPEQVAVEELKPHPRNYKQHPDDQLDHIIASINETGFYRNIVIAEDGTILAGHGVVQAAKKMGMATVPAIRLPLAPDDPRAIKVMVGDNEIGKLAEVNDWQLLDLLSDLGDLDLGLLGSGFDENMLNGLSYLTSPPDRDQVSKQAIAEQEWADAGITDYDPSHAHPKVTITFDTEEDRVEFMAQLGVKVTMSKARTNVISFVWPLLETQNDYNSVGFESAVENGAENGAE